MFFYDDDEKWGGNLQNKEKETKKNQIREEEK